MGATAVKAFEPSLAMCPLTNDALRSAETAAARSERLKRAFNDHVGQPKYAGDCTSSLMVLARTLAMYFLLWGAALYGGKHGMSLWFKAPLVLIWGLVHIRCFIVFHDCGHKSFIQGFKGARFWNEVVKYVMGVFSGCTPTDWNVGHALHHNNVGNIDQTDYEWCETVFHTKAEYLQMTPTMQRVVGFLRHPVVFFTMAPLATWWVRFRLPFEVNNFPKSHLRCWNKMFFLAAMIVMYSFAHRHHYLDVCFLSGYVAAVGGICLFHMQHVFENGYIKHQGEWTYHQASVDGSSLVLIPHCLKWVTMGIEYHHIHHARTRIPGYMLQQCHEEAPIELWEDVNVIGPGDMWLSLSKTVWDEDKQNFSTFPEVLADGIADRAAAKNAKLE